MIASSLVNGGEQVSSHAEKPAGEKTSPPTPQASPTIGTAEFVEMLGVSRGTFCKLRSKGVIPPPLLNISYPRWSRAFVLDWIARNGSTLRRK